MQQSLFIKKEFISERKINPIMPRAEGKQQVLFHNDRNANAVFAYQNMRGEGSLYVLMITHEKNNQPVWRSRARFSQDRKFPRQNQTKTRK
jgi:hypothetical protein